MTQFEFVVSAGRPERVTSAVRSHAVKSGLQRRSAKTKTAGSQQSENTINQKLSLTGRFRVSEATTTKKSAARKKASRISKSSTPLSDESDKSSQSSSSAHGSPSIEEEDIDLSMKPATMVSAMTLRNVYRSRGTAPPVLRAEEGYQVAYQISSDEYHLAPITERILPPQESLDKLFLYFIDKIAGNASMEDLNRYWWGVSVSDPTVIHTALGTVATMWAQCGTSDPAMAWQEASKYKALAIRGIREKLLQNKTGNDLVGAMANLAGMEGIVGDYDTALIHLRGIQQLVEAQGGLEAVRQDEDVSRAINWSDLLTAAGLGTRPMIPLLYPFERIKVPPWILKMAEQPSLTHLKRFESGPFDSSVRYIFSLVRQAHYMMLYDVLPRAKARHFINGADHYLSNVMADYEGQIAPRAILQGASLFMLLCVRKFRNDCLIPGIWKKRINQSYHHLIGDYCDTDNVKRQEYMHAVLWCLVLGTSASAPNDDDMIFTSDTIAKIADRMNIRSMEEIKAVCQQYLWDEEIMGACLKTIEHIFPMDRPNVV